MNELKVFVERAIRPVMADVATKLKMREELFAHATEVYQQEMAAGDKEAALARTLTRLGEPATLTVEYQSVVPRTEWFTAWLTDRFFRQREQEPRWRLATRIAGYNLLAMGGMMLLLLLPQVAADFVDRSPWAQITTRMSLGLLFSWTVAVFGLTLVASAMRDEFLSDRGVGRKVLRCGLLAIGAGLTVQLCGWGFALLAGDSSVGWAWLPLATVIGLGCVVGAWLTARERSGSDPWTSLQIEG